MQVSVRDNNVDQALRALGNNENRTSAITAVTPHAANANR